MCKDYAAGSVPPATTTFNVSVTGGTTANFSFSLTTGECAEVWVNGGAAADVATVTEVVPAGFAPSYAITTIVQGGQPQPGATGTNGAVTTIGGTGIPGALVVFTNTPLAAGDGRMTGGGFKVSNLQVTAGFTIHCDLVLSNNLELNWDKNKWHIDKPLTAATCSDDPAFDETPPVAPFNTFVGEGVGELNGVDGSIVKFTFIDAGEPGKDDLVKIQVFPPGGGAPVLDIPLQKIQTGNIQAHYDQPHGQHP